MAINEHVSVVNLSWLVAISCSIFIVNKLFGAAPDPREPPLIASIIPYFGHMIGLFWYRHNYYAQLSARYGHRIYSLAMPGGRIYVVTSPELAVSLQRQPKVVSFWFIEAKFTAKLGALSKEAGDKLLQNLKPGHSGNSMLLEGMKATHKALMPGESINQMVRIAAHTATTAMDKMETDKVVGAKRIDLWSWVQHEITMATTESVYGPLNPYRDPKIEKAWWDFAGDSIMLLTGIIPSVLASKGHRGRCKVTGAFEQYFATNGHDSGSDLVKARFRYLKDEISPNDIARFECVNGTAILINIVPTAFWTIFHVFSDERILENVRKAVSTALIVRQERGITHRVIDLNRVNQLPILASITQESLRHRGSGSGPRFVLEDIMLDDRHLLKKDSYLIMPSRDFHFDRDAWGETVNNFDPQRFMKSKSKRIPPGAFRAFGAGANLCPGKAYAIMEVAAMVAMLVLRYDMRPCSGKWVDPGQDTTNMSLAIGPPRDRILVDFVPRKGSEGGSWAFQL